MSDYVTELARKVQKSRPEATISVVVELKSLSNRNIETLSSKGVKIRRVVKPLNLVAGEINADPRVAESIKKLKIVRELDTSCELEIL